ncbi:hypothetical protein [Micrococcus sp.]|uniref:hypothetical protein n=1 Tax=Micrococcus sp. TaxID=1271 RepID=UPI002A915D92|nr:hypothetical protein [Micrococcus sp.]MDY6054743.1 hypothetical protein [Micrococcus sp.]
MRPVPTVVARTGLAAALTASLFTATGCGLRPSPAEGTMEPATVAFTIPTAEAGPGVTGRPYGCGDLLVPVQTVPVSGDRAHAAVDFLFASARKDTHGDPPLHNAVAATADTLTFTGHETRGDTEVFTFTGTVTAADTCAAERIRAQLQETARAQSSAAQVRLEVDGQPLDDVLGLAPLELGAETMTP